MRNDSDTLLAAGCSFLQSHQLLHDPVAHAHRPHQNQQVEDELAHIAPDSSHGRHAGIDCRRRCRHHRKEDAGQRDACPLQAYSRIAAQEIAPHAAGGFTGKGGQRATGTAPP